MTSPNTQSIIFVTIGNGAQYENKYIEGEHTMIWKGQDSGKRDGRVVPGTRVWFRKSSHNKHFKLIGTVETIEAVESGDVKNKIAATYMLRLNLFDDQPVIERTNIDRTTHQSILRKEGYSEDIIETAKWFPEGIY
jgi:hypothetical protein